MKTSIFIEMNYTLSPGTNDTVVWLFDSLMVAKD